MNLFRSFGLAIAALAVALTAAGGAESGNSFPAGDFPAAVAIQSDGKLVVAGWAIPGGVLVTRFEADGGLDSSFGSSGRSTTALDYGATSVAIDVEGRMLVLTAHTCSGFTPTASSTIRSATTVSWPSPTGSSQRSRSSRTA